MKKSILLLYLKKDHKIIETNHLINSLKDESDDYNISILTFEENRKYFGYFSDSVKFETIDTQFLKKISQNPLFSPSFAITRYWNFMAKVKSYNWDKIIPYNDNSLETLISTFVNADKSSSMKLNENGIIKYNSEWSVLNNLYFKSNKSYFHPSEIVHLISNVKFSKNNIKIKDKPNEENFVNEQIKELREGLENYHNLKNIKLIGISLVEMSNYFELKDIETIVSSIIEVSDTCHPVLISTGEEAQELLAEETRRLFHEKVTILTVDRTSEISLLKNLDFLVSLPNHQLELSSLVNCPSIEINFNSQTSLTGLVNDNAYKINVFDSLKVKTISETIDHALFGKNIDEINGQIIKSNFNSEIGYINIRSESIEIDTVKKKIIHLSMNPQLILKNKKIKDIKIKASIFNEVKKASSLILNALRIHKVGINNSQKLTTFIQAVSALWENSHQYEFIAPTLIHFQGRIENIDANTNPAQLISSLENELFSLKDRLKNIQGQLTASDEELTSTNIQTATT
ncbi:hypothetical protein N9N67_00655 [Bacteriovoracaceae bacterium]|nr:hypothetical protein [Bacteriovoracaceae bacterium]